MHVDDCAVPISLKNRIGVSEQVVPAPVLRAHAHSLLQPIHQRQASFAGTAGFGVLV